MTTYEERTLQLPIEKHYAPTFDEPLLEIALYFDASEHMSLREVADKLVAYPERYFKRHDLTLTYAPKLGGPGLLLLYNRRIGDPQIAYLQGLKEQGYIKSWSVSRPGTWSEYLFQTFAQV